jgi:NADH:ubiquinone oxidoreductase subunit 4 (subunit M)
MNIVIHIN